MSEPYQEVIEGETIQRLAPGPRHERVCGRLHAVVAQCLQGISVARLLAPRSMIQLTPGTFVRPDLTLVTLANGRLWLAAEVVDADDHCADTVAKKTIYEDVKVPRLWMVDPRYDNVEVYHASEYGLVLQRILASREVLREGLLPALNLTVADLFAD